jgi:cytochrome c oxidase assembly protein Cox11
MSSTAPSDAVALDARRNRRVALICGATFFLMLGAAFAAVPLYKAFCQVTGFDGAVRRAVAAPDQILAERLKVRFDANVRELPWTFTAEQASQSVRIGAISRSWNASASRNRPYRPARRWSSRWSISSIRNTPTTSRPRASPR